MSILQLINREHPVRKSAEEKKNFRLFILKQIHQLGYAANVEDNGRGKHHNVVVGKPDKARVIFTAHYDTPATIGLPNLMIPRNFPVYLLYQILIVGGMLAIALAAGIGLALLTGRGDLMLLGYFCVYMVLMLLMLYGVPNKHNVNDNTSGVATLLELMKRIPVEQRDKVAFILFDNEEKGVAGSKAYAKEHQEIEHLKLIVNLDCVGLGEHFLFSVPTMAKNLEEYELLQAAMNAVEGRQVHWFSSIWTRGNSDFRRFKCGVGVSAYSVRRGVGFITGRIHTARDTQADEENLTILADGLAEFAKTL